MIILLPFILPFTAQDRVEIITENGQRVVQLIGEVVFQKEGLRINCDQAKIYGQESALLKGNIVLEESTTTILAESLKFTIPSRVGLFYHSCLIEADLIIRSESLRYDPNTEEIAGFDSVVIEDTTNNTIIYGDFFRYNVKSGIGQMTGNSKFEILRDTIPPIRGRADTISYYREPDQINLIDSVVIIDQDLCICCDSLYYFNQSSSGDLFNLRIETPTGRIEGTSGTFKITDRKMESMTIDSAWVEREEEDRIDQLRCLKLIVNFTDGRITRAKATGSPWGRTRWK